MVGRRQRKPPPPTDAVQFLRRLEASPTRAKIARVEDAELFFHRERMRRYRKRQAAGRLSITTEFSQEETAKLCQLRYLAECELEDRDRIAAAIHALIANIVTEPSNN